MSFAGKAYIPALVGAGICLFFLKSGFLSFFFLVPLGFVSYVFQYKTAWFAFLFASLGNFFLTLLTAGNAPAALIIINFFYFAGMALIFTWITAPPRAFPPVSDTARLIGGSVLGALIFIFIVFRGMASSGFSEYVENMLNVLVSAYRSSGANVVESARLDMLNAEILMDTFKSVMLRGGSLVSSLLLFFVSSQMSIIFARFFLRYKGASLPERKSLTLFHVNPSVIWVLSASLLLVVFLRVLKLAAPEIILWNILIICIILYFTQGLGIIQFFLIRSSRPPFFRLLFILLFVIIVFSPFLNLLLLGGIAVLGIAENWAPLRVAKQNGPPSTPEAGGGGN